MVTDDYTSIVITDSHLAGGARLDKLMAGLWSDYSRVAMQNLIKSGAVLLDGEVCRHIARLVIAGQLLQVSFAEMSLPPEDCLPEDLPLDIIAEDDALLIVNKPVGLVVHPGHGNWRGTLQARIMHHHAAAKHLPRGGLVHRLDKDTSGLLAVAKTAAAQRHLIGQFQTGDIRRVYLALVRGVPPATGVIDLPIGRHRRQPTKMAVRTNGKPAITRYATEKQWRNFSLLRCFLETGRTHQIRVHLSHKGYPIVGDATYGKPSAADLLINRQALHATELRLLHPMTEAVCAWHCPPPQDIVDLLANLDAGVGKDGH